MKYLMIPILILAFLMPTVTDAGIYIEFSDWQKEMVEELLEYEDQVLGRNGAFVCGKTKRAIGCHHHRISLIELSVKQNPQRFRKTVYHELGHHLYSKYVIKKNRELIADLYMESRIRHVDPRFFYRRKIALYDLVTKRWISPTKWKKLQGVWIEAPAPPKKI